MQQSGGISGFSSVFSRIFFFENFTKNRKTYQLGAYQLRHFYNSVSQSVKLKIVLWRSVTRWRYMLFLTLSTMSCIIMRKNSARRTFTMSEWRKLKDFIKISNHILKHRKKSADPNRERILIRWLGRNIFLLLNCTVFTMFNQSYNSAFSSKIKMFFFKNWQNDFSTIYH